MTHRGVGPTSTTLAEIAAAIRYPCSDEAGATNGARVLLVWIRQGMPPA